jgi:hypothetical protein
MTSIEEVVQRLDRRENSRIVAYREVGLPVFRLNSLVTLQEAGSLGAIEEFVLRCLIHGIDTSTDIQDFLGLPHQIILGQLGNLAFDGEIGQVEASPPRYVLTRRGRTRLEESVAARLTKEQMPIYIDGITRAVVSADPQELWTNLQLAGLGITVVAPIPRRAPRVEDIDVVGVNRMIGIVSGIDRLSKRAVRVDAIVGRVSLQFRRAITVAFKSDDRKQISIGFAIDGRGAEEHDIAFARATADQTSILYRAMRDSDRRRRAAQMVAREFRGDLPALLPSALRGGNRAVLRLRTLDAEPIAKETEGVKPVQVYEHVAFLEQAFQEARDRIVIVCPRIRSRVVDQAFVNKLVTCLVAGVEVTIAYAIGKRPKDEHVDDVKVREALFALAEKYPNLHLVEKSSFRARVLLVDDRWFVVTTFDWLSFRADGNQAMREEEGMLIEKQDAVNEYYNCIVKRLAEQST